MVCLRALSGVLAAIRGGENASAPSLRDGGVEMALTPCLRGSRWELFFRGVWCGFVGGEDAFFRVGTASAWLQVRGISPSIFLVETCGRALEKVCKICG